MFTVFAPFAMYLYLFPLFVGLFFLLFSLVSKKAYQKKSISFYGLFMYLSTWDIISLSLLGVFYILILESLFVFETSYAIYLLIGIPLGIFLLTHFKVLRFLGNLLGYALLIGLLFFKNVFYSYMIDVTHEWYVILLFVVLCLFIVLLASYLVFVDLYAVIQSDPYIQKRMNSK